MCAQQQLERHARWMFSVVLTQLILLSLLSTPSRARIPSTMKVCGVAAIAAANVFFATTNCCLAVAAVSGGPSQQLHYGISSRWTAAALSGIPRNDDADQTRKSLSLRSNLAGLAVLEHAIPIDEKFQQQQQRSLAFGDYIDPSFACPAMVTCNIVCVANVTDCPADAQCPGTTADGGASTSNHTYEVREEKERG